MRWFRLSGLLPAAALALALGCTGTDRYRPGTSLGTFKVDGKLTANTCSKPGEVPDPWTFQVDLGRDPGVLYWIQGGAPVNGRLDATGRATMSVEGITEVRKPQGKIAGCTISRIDDFDGTIPTTGEVTAFKGTLGYRYAVVDGDCQDLIAENGGGFQTLPCAIRYDVVGTRTVAPKK